ncbi:MAG TPA: AI-2E family transporter, partial [Actinotalea sp.]|nr:AI-2E family transporter [Actinotalea sp.]
MSSDVNATVPRAVQVAAAWSWRVLAILLGLAAFVAVLAYSKLIWVPVLIALLLAVLLQPFVELLQRRAGFGRGLASAVAVVVLVLGLAGLLVLTGRAIARGVADLWLQAREGVRELIGFLADGPLGLDGDQLDALIDELSNQLGSNTGTLVSGALSVTVTIGHILAGTLLTLFCLLFFLKDGAQIWAWLVRLLPQAARMPVYEASRRGVRTLTSFTRTQILVALIDAVGIGLGAFILGIPLAGPLAILVFVGSFIPFVGAVVTGAIAVLVAFVDQGLGTALLMLGVVLLVQQ